MTKGDLARQNFKSGYNCSQAVALAFQDKIGMDPDTIAHRLWRRYGSYA